MNDTPRVFRVQKDRNFTIVKNNFIDDARLSMKATAILLLALRYPDHWRMSVKTMTKLKSDKESSISSGFKELVAFGYAEYRKTRNTVTGKFESGWYFFEESQKPNVQSVPNRSKKEELKQGELFAEEEIKSPGVENPGPDLPLSESPHLENPVAVNPGLENQPLSNTIYQGLSKQVLFNQIQNTSREYRLPAKTHREEHNQDQHKQKENPRFQFPAAWLIKFQDYYFKEHGSEMGQPDSELKALNKLYEISNGDWNVIESKIQTLIQLRKQDLKFWYEQSLSPESITKFWSRLFEREVKPTEKNRIRNEQQNKSIRTESKYNESKTIQETPIEELNNLDPYKCFLVWGKSKLLKSQLEYYEQNSDPFKYEGTKKILYEKFVNEVYPGLVSNSEVKKTTIENRKGSAA
ncbi:helix-turn-helix domain-containing protein [Leptospira borgpetersenii]|uniref:helix-turn-helix domain-containing protein n=1 Tax=Leptospira borgpetersenii TaxID=174 RepID=UPI000774D374|nr:helix-turn-helix domain-containing protein [Leptospira borgpetersenii]